MSERLRVVRRGFQYPADAESLALVRKHGGLSKIPTGVTVRMKTVAIGDWCDDMPAESAAIYLQRGDIERVSVDDAPSERVARPSRKGVL